MLDKDGYELERGDEVLIDGALTGEVVRTAEENGMLRVRVEGDDEAAILDIPCQATGWKCVDAELKKTVGRDRDS